MQKKWKMLKILENNEKYQKLLKNTENPEKYYKMQKNVENRCRNKIGTIRKTKLERLENQ